MATVVLTLDTRNKKAAQFPVAIRLTHKGIPKMIPTGYKLKKENWDDRNKKVKRGYPNSSRANTRIYNKFSIAEDVITKYTYHLKEMTVYQLAKVIKEAINREVEEKSGEPAPLRTTLNLYGTAVARMYEKGKQFSQKKTCEKVVDEVLSYTGNPDFLITQIDETFLLNFQAHLKNNGSEINTIGVYYRMLRRIMNLAIKDGSTEVTQEHYPFGTNGYKIKREKTKKRAIKLDDLLKIKELPYKEGSPNWHHRNYMFFMFYMRGMNFVDLAYLTRENIKEDRLIYQRRKTRHNESVREFNFKITGEAMMILDYYLQRKLPRNLVFPILDDVIECGDDYLIYRRYNNRRDNHNRQLKLIAKAAGLTVNMTTYVIRHTFATAGLHKGVSKALIGDMLGHTNYNTTEVYFDEFDQSVLDDAASQILG